MNKKTLNILVGSLFCASFLYCQNLQIDNEYKNMLKQCENYVLNYDALRIEDTDTVVSAFKPVPDSINKFLFQCAENNDFSPLKYAVVLVMKQNMAYEKYGSTDNIIWNDLEYDNGFVALFCKAMNIDYDDDYGSGIFTGDMCMWAVKNKNKIKDYRFIEKYGW